MNNFECFRPLTGNGIFNCRNNLHSEYGDDCYVSVPSRGTGFLMGIGSL